MNNGEYAEQAKKTRAAPNMPFSRMTMEMMDFIHVSEGLVTEAGEFTDALKKHIFYGKPLDRVNLVEELGDIFWYTQMACDLLGVTEEQVKERNIAKLAVRYPEKFTEFCAENRKLVDERASLEVCNRIGHLV